MCKNELSENKVIFTIKAKLKNYNNTQKKYISLLAL